MPRRATFCRTCSVALPKAVVHAWCDLCSASYCLGCARAHHCCETCDGAGCTRGDCCKLVVDGRMLPHYGVRDLEDLAGIARAWPRIAARGAR